MSFADILPYLAGGLAGAAVPGLGRGAGQAMSMQQAFENQEKRDARYDDETAYRRGRDTAGDSERQSDRLYRRGRDTVGDLERKDDKAYSRGRNAALDAERTANTQWSQDFSEEGRQIQGENRAKDIAFRKAGRDHEWKRQESMDPLQRSAYGLQIQKGLLSLQKDQKAAEGAELFTNKLSELTGTDVTGIPPNMAWQLTTLIESQKEGQAKEVTLDDLKEIADNITELEDMASMVESENPQYAELFRASAAMGAGAMNRELGVNYDDFMTNLKKGKAQSIAGRVGPYLKKYAGGFVQDVSAPASALSGMMGGPDNLLTRAAANPLMSPLTIGGALLETLGDAGIGEIDQAKEFLNGTAASRIDEEFPPASVTVNAKK